MKAFTDLEQSKKLAEILPLESADMHYVLIDSDKNLYSEGLGNYIGILPHYPCWSLAALFNILPNNKHITTTLSRGGWKIEPAEYIDKWFCEYEDDDDPCKNFTTSADNSIDACYEMILKLKEQNLL